MPWSNNHLPKYRKHRASGQAVVTLNGRDFYLGPHGTKASKIEYDRLLGEWLASGRNPLCASSDELTVVELCARYFKFAKGHYQKDGQCTKVLPGLKCALRYLRERYGRQLASEFGPLALKALREQMIGDSLSRRYINDYVEKIKRMFKWAVGEQLLPAAVYQALLAVEGLRKGRSSARETDPILPVKDVVVEATLACLPDVVADMVRLQRITGMRPAEVCIVRPHDIDRSGMFGCTGQQPTNQSIITETGSFLSGPRLKQYFSATWLGTPSATAFDLAIANKNGELNNTGRNGLLMTNVTR